MENLNERLSEINYEDLTGQNFQNYESLINELAPAGDGKFKPKTPILTFEEFKATAVFSDKENRVIGVRLMGNEPVRTVSMAAYDAKIMNQQIANSRVTPVSYFLIKK